ncbi:hypothetical protein EYF80_048541 [Liparis tanakae]|uniref:Uncharacterized protein n=1 Tax=Liparis tanakae TaxID=230148 RepID=A0A4Z2FJA7_9TELE|nr:hypothetical protein EYF80_048541 [Liparis tanakae]
MRTQRRVAQWSDDANNNVSRCGGAVTQPPRSEQQLQLMGVFDEKAYMAGKQLAPGDDPDRVAPSLHLVSEDDDDDRTSSSLTSRRTCLWWKT